MTEVIQSHLVLSGGLGNSAYVQNCMRNRYASGNTSHANARNMQIRIAPDPQLVVCKGNVADRVQKLRTGQSILGWRCCRASYGTMCKTLHEPHNPAHFGLKTERDALDGKYYVVNCVDWFIKQVSCNHRSGDNGNVLIMQIRANQSRATTQSCAPSIANAQPSALRCQIPHASSRLK